MAEWHSSSTRQQDQQKKDQKKISDLVKQLKQQRYAITGLQVKDSLTVESDNTKSILERANTLLDKNSGRLIFVLGSKNNIASALLEHLMNGTFFGGLGIPPGQIQQSFKESDKEQALKGAVFFCFPGHNITDENGAMDLLAFGADQDSLKNIIVQEVKCI